MQDTCRGKVEELLSRFTKDGLDWDLLICGDTILEHHNNIIEKPVPPFSSRKTKNTVSK